ncbi:helix-turn-helix transcriptional regulator [Thermopolyspora sp. NPDC052614]|uniref:helix-turn-helix domain-containing protein n=1 Tax=Thermopolyspora sp. NPDC052614 TaxID=3155682 RepID=UPI00342A5E0E
MPERGSPTLRHRRLGRELRRLRERIEMIGDEVAARLNWSTAKVSRIENAKTLPTARDVEALLELYGADRDVRRELLELRRGAAQKGWWEEYRGALQADLIPLLGLEVEATTVRNWESQIVPGLLQTQEYARAVMEHNQQIIQVPHSWLRARVEARMMRQKILLLEANPVTLLAVFEESVLRRQFGDSAVMRGQLQKLIEISELDHVEMRILPQETPPSMPTGPFVHLTLPDFPDTVYLEDFFGAHYVEDPERVYAYERAFEHLMDMALDEESSRRLIQKALERW